MSDHEFSSTTANTAIIPFPDDLDVNEDGYPSETRIDQVRLANDIPNAAHWLVEIFPCLVNSIGYGSVEVRDGVNDFNRPIKVVAFSTGGWSGQEDLIHAMEGSMIGMFYLWSWRRGGHYEFRVPTVQSEGAA